MAETAEPRYGPSPVQQPSTAPTSELEQERRRLQAEIADLTVRAAVRDAKGGMTDDSFQASQRLEKLNDDYRQILIALKTPASASDTITRTDGSVYRIGPDNKPVQVLGPGGKPLGTNTVTTNTTDQFVVSVDQNTGALTTVKNPNYVPPKPGQVTTNTSDQFIVQSAPDGTLTNVPNPNYVPPKPSTIATDTTSKFIVQQKPDGTVSTVPNPNYVEKTPTTLAGTTDTQSQFIVQQMPDGSTKTIPNPNYVPKTPTTVSTSADQPFIVRQKPDGTVEQVPNPNYQPKPTVVTTDTTSPFIVRQQPDGTVSQVPNPNYQAPKPTVVQAGATEPYITTMDATGKLVSQPNPSFQPKTPGDIAARVGQIQTLAQSKRDEVQAKIGQGSYTADNALQEFNSWWDKNVAPQQAALAAAQEDVAFNRAKDTAAMRTSAYTAANAAANAYSTAFDAEKTNRVGPRFGEVVQQALSNKPLGQIDMTDAFTYRAKNPTDAAMQATQNALKYIDPSSAAANGLPPPNLGGMNPTALLDRTQFMPGAMAPPAPAPAPAPAAAAPAAAPSPVAQQPGVDFQALMARQQADAELQRQQAQVGPPGTSSGMPAWLNGTAPPPPPGMPAGPRIPSWQNYGYVPPDYSF